jgi:hypothetical protein
MTETLTFALAVAAYGGLAIAAALATRSRQSFGLSAVTAVLVLAHVTLVWHDRFAWDLARATRNGYAGFAVFHAALTCIVLAPWVTVRIASPLTIASFLLVTAGAFGAVFRDAAAARFRVPVLVVGIAGLAALSALTRQRRRSVPAISDRQ